MANNFSKLTDPVNPQSYEDKFIGVIPGIVISNDDPEKIGRVKVECPIIAQGEPLPNGADGWVSVTTLFTLNEVEGGMLCPLEEGTQVLLAPIMGDITSMVVIGSLFNRLDRPYHEFDRSRGITGTMSKSGKIKISDDSVEGKGAEVLQLPSGYRESISGEGSKLIESPFGATLGIDHDGGIRIENEKSHFALSKEGLISQSNGSGAHLTFDADGEISLYSAGSPHLKLTREGVTVKAQKDKITDLKKGLETSLSGAFAGTLNTYNVLSAISSNLDSKSISREYTTKLLVDTFDTADKNFDNYQKSNSFLAELEEISALDMGQRVVNQIDLYREYGLDKLSKTIEKGGFNTSEELVAIITDTVPEEILGKLNLDLGFLDDLISGNLGDLKDISSIVMGNLIPNSNGIMDLESLLAFGVAEILGEIGLNRTISDLLMKVVDGGGFALTDFGSILGELGVGGELLNNVSEFVTGITDFVDEAWDMIDEYFNMAQDFLNNIDDMVMDFLGISIPFGLDGILSNILQLDSLLDKATDFLDQIKGKVDQVEGLITQLTNAINDTSLQEKFGNEIKTDLSNLSSIVASQQDLSPVFSSGKEFAHLLLDLESFDTFEELPLLLTTLDQIDDLGFFDTSELKKMINDVQLTPTLNSVRLVLDDFLQKVWEGQIPHFIGSVIRQINPTQLAQANRQLIETTKKISNLDGGNFNASKNNSQISSNSFHSGANLSLSDKAISVLAPGANRNFGSGLFMDKDVAQLKTCGSDMGLGCSLEVDQTNFGIFSPGSKSDLGSKFSLNQKKISLKTPGADNSMGSFLELEQEKASLFSPGGDSGMGTSVVAELKHLVLNGSGQKDDSKNHAFIDLKSNGIDIFAPGGANKQASELTMTANNVHLRSGSELPTDWRGRLSMSAIESSLFAPYETTIFNSYLTMNRLFAELNGGYIVGPNSNLRLGSESLLLAKRTGIVPMSRLLMTDVSVNLSAALVGAFVDLTAENLLLAGSPVGSYLTLNPAFASITPTGGLGIFMSGPLIFIN